MKMKGIRLKLNVFMPCRSRPFKSGMFTYSRRQLGVEVGGAFKKASADPKQLVASLRQSAFRAIL
ncbi:MAG: hypothetical protein E5Y30_20270 [Mesorhizobium sp.]|nr:MAG: hypothetical protein E5Y30_20270 [Mesorhizobium sp.]